MRQGRDSHDPVTAGRLPILTVLRQAFLIPARHPRQLVVTVLVAAVFIAALLAVLRRIGGDALNLDNLAPGGIQNAIEASGLGIGGALAVIAVMFAGLLMLAAGLFNYWVRLTLLGPGGAWRQGPGEWAVQIFSNFAFFVCIFVVMLFFSVSAGFAYAFIGLIGATMSVARLAATFTAWGVLSYAGFILLVCFLYSACSMALVRGAIWRADGGARWSLGAPGGMKRFAIVLLFIVVAFDIVATATDDAVGYLLGRGATALSGFVLGVLLLCIVAAAHAVAYRLTTDHGGDGEETSPTA